MTWQLGKCKQFGRTIGKFGLGNGEKVKKRPRLDHDYTLYWGIWILSWRLWGRIFFWLQKLHKIIKGSLENTEKYKEEILFFFPLHHKACRILVPQAGIKPVPPAVEAQSLNHWLKKVPFSVFFFFKRRNYITPNTNHILLFPLKVCYHTISNKFTSIYFHLTYKHFHI